MEHFRQLATATLQLLTRADIKFGEMDGAMQVRSFLQSIAEGRLVVQPQPPAEVKRDAGNTGSGETPAAPVAPPAGENKPAAKAAKAPKGDT